MPASPDSRLDILRNPTRLLPGIFHGKPDHLPFSLSPQKTFSHARHGVRKLQA